MRNVRVYISNARSRHWQLRRCSDRRVAGKWGCDQRL